MIALIALASRPLTEEGGLIGIVDVRLPLPNRACSNVRMGTSER